MASLPTTANEDTPVIDGGQISEVSELRVDPLKKDKAETTKRLAIILVVVLATSFLVHFIALMVLLMSGRQAEAETLNQTFSTWLPVISGLASSAVTYYFTKEK